MAQFPLTAWRRSLDRVLQQGGTELLGYGWVEDPGYRGAQTAPACGDLTVVPVPVDADGLRTSASDWKNRPPRLVCTTPAHQYPTGAVLTASRRLDLIEKCRLHGAWIVEDDYDSEFRHSGEPLACMQGLAPDAPVFYVGTFSKTLFPPTPPTTGSSWDTATPPSRRSHPACANSRT